MREIIGLDALLRNPNSTLSIGYAESRKIVTRRHQPAGRHGAHRRARFLNGISVAFGIELKRRELFDLEDTALP
jgi:hypothetical protein